MSIGFLKKSIKMVNFLLANNSARRLQRQALKTHVKTVKAPFMAPSPPSLLYHTSARLVNTFFNLFQKFFE